MAIASSVVDASGAEVSARGSSGKPVERTEFWFLVVALIFVTAGGVLGCWLGSSSHHASPVVLRHGITVFALLYVGAQVIERLLVPRADVTASRLRRVFCLFSFARAGESSRTTRARGPLNNRRHCVPQIHQGWVASAP